MKMEKKFELRLYTIIGEGINVKIRFSPDKDGEKEFDAIFVSYINDKKSTFGTFSLDGQDIEEMKFIDKDGYLMEVNSYYRKVVNLLEDTLKGKPESVEDFYSRLTAV
jgi:hypothetical protein